MSRYKSNVKTGVIVINIDTYYTHNKITWHCLQISCSDYLERTWKGKWDGAFITTEKLSITVWLCRRRTRPTCKSFVPFITDRYLLFWIWIKTKNSRPYWTILQTCLSAESSSTRTRPSLPRVGSTKFYFFPQTAETKWLMKKPVLFLENL